MNLVKAWGFQDLLLEAYDYEPGRLEDVPLHSHEEYQFGLNLTHPGVYYYRNSRHIIPVNSLSIIQPGEVHATESASVRENHSLHRCLYVPPGMLERLAADAAGCSVPTPFFPTPILLDKSMCELFLALHQMLESNAPNLEKDSLLLLALTRLLTRYAQAFPPSPPPQRADTAAEHAREYLRTHFADNVTLAELALIADMSAFHLGRVFRRRFGLRPHAYQAQVRIAQAKRMLIGGIPLGQVAVETGFYDQSYFAARFKALVGVTPSTYAMNARNK